MANLVSTFFQQLSKPSVTNDPPDASQAWRNDLLVIGTVAFALLLGIGVRNQFLNASQTIDMGENLPRITVPDRWLTKQENSGMFRVTNPESASIFDAEIDLEVRARESNDPIEAERVNLTLERSKALENYRELDARDVLLRPQIGRSRGDETPGILTTYAYVADPTLNSGANGLPVVVQAQDLLFLQDGNLVIVTLAADAADWAQESQHFQRVLDNLRVVEKEVAEPGEASDATAPGEESGASEGGSSGTLGGGASGAGEGESNQEEGSGQ